MAAELRGASRAEPVTTKLVPRVDPGPTGAFTLRAARDDDAEAIVTLIADVWSEYPGKTLVAAVDMPELLSPASSYAARNGRFWVVQDAGQIVGTIAVAPSETEDGVVELQKLYVARSHRCEGLGAMLCGLVEREAQARGAHAIELWSDLKLRDAHRLYEGLDYRRGQSLKAYSDTSGTIRCYYRKSLAHELRRAAAPRLARTMFKMETAFGGARTARGRLRRIAGTLYYRIITRWVRAIRKDDGDIRDNSAQRVAGR